MSQSKSVCIPSPFLLVLVKFFSHSSLFTIKNFISIVIAVSFACLNLLLSIVWLTVDTHIHIVAHASKKKISKQTLTIEMDFNFTIWFDSFYIFLLHFTFSFSITQSQYAFSRIDFSWILHSSHVFPYFWYHFLSLLNHYVVLMVQIKLIAIQWESVQ